MGLSTQGRALRLLLSLAVVVSVAVIQGCALFYKAPSVKIVEVRVTSLGLSSGHARVRLEITNDTGRAMEIRGFLYEVEVKGPGEGAGWSTLAEGFYDQVLMIHADEVASAEIPVPFEYSALGEALLAVLSTGEVPYRLHGEIWIGGSSAGLQIPYRQEGVLKP